VQFGSGRIGSLPSSFQAPGSPLPGQLTSCRTVQPSLVGGPGAVLARARKECVNARLPGGRDPREARLPIQPPARLERPISPIRNVPQQIPMVVPSALPRSGGSLGGSLAGSMQFSSIPAPTLQDTTMGITSPRAAACRCGNIFMTDSQFCRKCGAHRESFHVARGASVSFPVSDYSSPRPAVPLITIPTRRLGSSISAQVLDQGTQGTQGYPTTLMSRGSSLTAPAAVASMAFSSPISVIRHTSSPPVATAGMCYSPRPVPRVIAAPCFSAGPPVAVSSPAFVAAGQGPPPARASPPQASRVAAAAPPITLGATAPSARTSKPGGQVVVPYVSLAQPSLQASQASKADGVEKNVGKHWHGVLAAEDLRVDRRSGADRHRGSFMDMWETEAPAPSTLEVADCATSVPSQLPDPEPLISSLKAACDGLQEDLYDNAARAMEEERRKALKERVRRLEQGLKGMKQTVTQMIVPEPDKHHNELDRTLSSDRLSRSMARASRISQREEDQSPRSIAQH